MARLTDKDIEKIIGLLQQGKPVPEIYKSKLFSSGDKEYIELTKEYQLVYKGKKRKEDVIADTPETPLQEVRSFNTDNPFEGEWRNMLIFGDNLMALKTIYEDQRGPNSLGTKNKIKLIYIDPPFATKQDFMKDREKAYRDKIIGAQFIEFLRKRLIFLREVLADDGSIYVHLDWKKGHYIKAIMDEVFGEHNFVNQIAWCYETAGKSKTSYSRKHDYILFFRKTEDMFFDITKSTISRKRGKHMLIGIDEDGREYEEKVDKKSGKVYRWYFDAGRLPLDYWIDIPFLNREAKERTAYPTQKPEKLLERIIANCTNQGAIVLDAFAGSGTTLAVAEKLGRRWIGMDCGKLAIYTIQKRMLNLTTQIGSLKKDERNAYERVGDLDDHLKNSQALLLVNEKAKKGELEITDDFIDDLHKIVSRVQKIGEFSLICPEDKFKVRELGFKEDDDGRKLIKKGKITYVISFIEPKEKTEKEKPLKAKAFTLFNAGVYDNDAILNLDWERYREFVLKLFEVREERHKINGFEVDGYIGVYSAYVWDYPDHKKLMLDEGYVESLHKTLGGKAGDKFYLIAPVISFSFMMDEIRHGNTIYVFLKVPISVLYRLIEKREMGAFKQPVSEGDVNEVIDAVGFDFISQPIVKTEYIRMKPEKVDLLSHKQRDYVIRIREFKSDTLLSNPEDFQNFETLSMVLLDYDFDRKVFDIENLYRDVLEIENRLSWGYDSSRIRYVFPLYNLRYSPVQATTETKNKPASDPQSFGFGPQMRVYTTSDRFSESGEHSFEIWTKDNLDMESAASFLHMYLKMKDPEITKRWTLSRIKKAFVSELKDNGYDYTFLSKENYIKAQQAFGTLMRGLNEENPRLSQRNNEIAEVKVEDMSLQTFNEGELKDDGMMFYDQDSLSSFKGDQVAVFSQQVTASRDYEKFCESFERFGGNRNDLRYLKERIIEIDITRFRTPLNIVYVTHEPERKFMKDLFSNIHLFDSFIKNPSRSFYSFPYSYKPETEAKTHVRQDKFNPDFFLKKDDDIIVVEIKKDDDDSKKNKAKYRDGSRHFEDLNKTLKANGIPQRYYFKFLSPDDYVAFFESVRDGSYEGWKSSLMNMLEE